MRVKAFETIIVRKGLIDPAAVDAIIDHYEHKIGPHIGAELIARAFVDPVFKVQLVNNTNGILSELGFGGRQGEHIVIMENTLERHNLVVCTLCSCYPFSILGIAPNWYKTAAYRSRAVRDPRGVLTEFGVSLNNDVQIHVWDSTAELRYLVLPQRPAGTESLGEEQLAKLVTRNSMIGTDRNLSTQTAGES